jgi:ribosomal protein L32
MNATQRNNNRLNARLLANNAHTCENCGEKGRHWISTRCVSLAALITGQDDSEGFWVCPKLYGEDGRRL